MLGVRSTDTLCTFKITITDADIDTHSITTKITMIILGGTIQTQICLYGTLVCQGPCVIKTRYIPPGSDCTIEDDAGVVVEKTIHARELVRHGCMFLLKSNSCFLNDVWC